MYSLEEIRSIPIFFIVGRGRSGTTLLSTILDSHPNVASAIESRFLLYLWKRYGKMKRWNKDMAEEFYNDLMVDSMVRKLWVFQDDFLETLKALPEQTSFQDLIKVVHLSRKSSFPKDKIKYIFDKNPFYSLQLDVLIKIFPDAKFYRLIRDPRDSVSSHNRKFSESTVFFSYMWDHFNKRIDQFSLQHPNRVFTQRFEDLILDKVSFFKVFEQFTGIASLAELEDKRIDFKNQIEAKYDKRLKSLHKESVNPLQASKIGEYKKNLSADQINIIDQICFPNAERYGYEREGKPIRLSLSQHFTCFKKRLLRKHIRMLHYRFTPFFLLKLIDKRSERKIASSKTTG